MIIPALIPKIVTWLFPSRVWCIPTAEKELYLSFDDGPDPRITPKVLDMLAQYGAKASFFCIGDRVKRFPEIYQRILDEGHAVGNHTFNHFNGWKTNDADYLKNIDEASLCIESRLFRPPYGRMRGSQAGAVANIGFKTIMWTVLSGDYSSKLSPGDCAKRVLDHIAPGLIYLFHDSEKAEKNMLYALGELLEVSRKKGFRCEKMNENLL